jgi:alkylhydroperoxidase family enzyme
MSADGLTRLLFDDVDPALRAELQPVVDRLGYFGEFFQVCAAVPGAVSGLMAYTRAVKAPLSDAENEVLALAVCAELGAAYELIQHERLSVRLGLQAEWVAAAEGRDGADAALLSAGETALRALALAAVQRMGKDCTREVAAVAALLGAEKAAASMMQVTRFIGIAVMCNALSLSLPVPSIFEMA